MALQLGALRDALIEAGATEALAKAASEEVATYDSRLASIDTRLTLLTWMVGASLAANAGIGWMMLRIAAKVGAI